MRLMTRLSVAISTTAVLALSFAGIGSVSAHGAVAAQAAVCPADYSADVGSGAKDVGTTAPSGAVDKISALALKLIQLRYKYEDNTVPAGCEAEQVLDIKRLALLEDGLFLTLGSLVDTKNASAYGDAVATWTPRIKALNAPATPSDAPAAATMAATAASIMCPDAAFTAKVGTFFAGFNLQATETDPAVIGAAGLKVIAGRYSYEDLTAPAGCEPARAQLVKLLLLAGDQVTLTLAKVADKANAATYDAFIKKDLTDRGNKLSATLGNYFDFSTLMSATPAATMAATASN